MKTYHVFEHPTRGLEAVKVGVSWPGFFFGFFWMLVKKMWGWALLFLAIDIVRGLFQMSITHGQPPASAANLGFALVGLVLGIIVGAYGNGWRESNLRNRGYVSVATVEAKTPDGALAQYAREKTQ
ncbi:DUF2628 domain-containing protein [Acidithiobacillus sp. 'AMD consortium']|jgi:hypothetical protein|uniref:DUF2628 domain-containing protein n=2 Tax=Acidithiobacillus ferridurans TaxID=1232575 RepID=A0A8X8G8X9_ACIFI|nr:MULTISPECIES: DUF2628 domain-containing protein [Acidithiobacillus]MBU2717387.1 DUF2628 domain-containing protein [Acidithiobacillus ferridurans]MBU2722412.1 DUF2628 domain-containing protein [Acidithiobacillus ferridurans]MBU2726399.1 DUF2628 domain-containing protein [Acidithiobacillus ferridurans]QFG78522.1 DUF2628 domain-containing protein [Acidithiobacillus sp. 'AMD consortium']BBF66582.1 hypothetical protein AFERRID_28000 [Acidithiobacillus ferridurans]